MAKEHTKEHESKELTVKKEASLPSLPPDLDFASDADEFGANYTQEQMTTPFLNILNALSPQVSRGRAEFIKEAQVGQLYNTVTKELYDGEKGINLILSTFKESYIEWIPRSEGGGYVAEYDVLEGSRGITVRDINNNMVIQPGSPVGTPGHWLVLTHSRLGAIVSEDYSSWSPVVLSLSNSGITASRNLNARHKLMEWINPSTGLPGALGKCPMPLILWRLKTILRTNKNNDTWFSWDFEKQCQVNDLPQDKWLNLYRSIRDFSSSAKGKQAMEDAARNAEAVDPAMEAKNVTNAKDEAGDIPF